MTHYAVQGSEEWFQERCGRATASNYRAVLSVGKGITRSKYKTRLAVERVTGTPKVTYTNDDMEEGKRLEKYARAAYLGKTLNRVQEVGFIKHPTLETGASPDGLIGDDGLIEIKCVNEEVQMETIYSQKMPTMHIPQVQGQMWITGRKWCDFVSFCNGYEGDGRIFIVRVMRDDAYIWNLKNEVKRFLTEVDEMVSCFRKITGG